MVCCAAGLWSGWPGGDARATGLPVPSFSYFGEVRDAYGWPFLAVDAAQVIAYRMDGRECGRAPVDEAMGAVINYRLEVAMAESRGSAYATYAARQGEAITLVLETGGVRYPVTLPSRLAPVGAPGGQVRQDLLLGTDADQDGLPDAWEDWLVEASGGWLKSRADVRPEDDFDGDGVSNGEEYLAGTDPAWAEDFPFLEAVQYDAAVGRVAVAVLTLPGRTYRVFGASTVDAADGQWTPRLIGRDAGVEPRETHWRGDGKWTWVYLRLADQGTEFLRLEVR